MPRHHDILIALRRIIRATDSYSKHLSKVSGLTAPQLLIMQAIHNSGDVTIKSISRQVSLSQATVTTILDRLESRDLIRRLRSQTDKRIVHASLTKEGESLLNQAPTPLQQHFVERFQQLNEWEQHLLLSSVQRIAEMMDAQGLDAAPLLDVGEANRQSE